MRLHWWDVEAGVAREAVLPDIALDVAAGSVGNAAVPTSAAAQADTALALPQAAAAPQSKHWIALAAAFALLWLVTLVWALRRRRVQVKVDDGVKLAVAKVPTLAELRKALDAGGLDEVAQILCKMAGVNALDQVVERLQSPPQREAIICLQRARWAGQGDVVAARDGVRNAFWSGPQWSAPAPSTHSVLEPLYPHRDR
jgi:hypothetical protein